MSGIAVRYLWHFGDEETSSERNPLHEYTVPGVYTVVLEIWDDDGNHYRHIELDYIRVYENDYSGFHN